MREPAKPLGRAPFAVELLQPASNDTILNVGCFDGGLELHYLLGHVKSFRGVDMNDEALKRARLWAVSHGLEEQTFQHAPAEKLPFPDASFSKVLCLDTFEHVQDERATASEIHRVLKPGGVLVLSVPHDFLNFLDPDELTRGARNFVRKYIRKKPLLDHPEHRHYSQEQLENFFSQFKIEVVHKCGTPVFWSLAMLYTGVGLPEAVVRPLSRLTAPLENWDYKTTLPTGFNIMIRARKL